MQLPHNHKQTENMTPNEINRAEDYITGATFPIHARKYGHVIRLEQRDGSHLIGAGLNVFPESQTAQGILHTFKDLEAIAKDSGKTFRIER